VTWRPQERAGPRQADHLRLDRETASRVSVRSFVDADSGDLRDHFPLVADIAFD
jgi:hypothetical protein